MGIEVMLTYNSHETTEDFYLEKWKAVNVKWLQETFGKDNVISAALHQDETANHIHAVVIPMVDEKLNCKHFLGGRAKMIALQDSYGKAMENTNIGLQRGLKGSTAKHSDIKRMYNTINKALEYKAPEINKGTFKKEKIEDYKERADEYIQDLQLRHIYEKTKMQRAIKAVYKAPTEEEALSELEGVKEIKHVTVPYIQYKRCLYVILKRYELFCYLLVNLFNNAVI